MKACSLAQQCAHERGGFLRYLGLRRALWTSHCQSRRVHDRETFRNTWIFHTLEAGSVLRLCTNKEDGSWENLGCGLCNPQMNIDSSAGRLKDWCDVFALHVSCVECDTAPGVGDCSVKQDSLKSTQVMERLPVHSGDGNYKNFKTTAWLFLRVSLIEMLVLASNLA